MKQFLPFLLLFGLLVVLASAADYSAPNPGPSKNLRAWSLLQTSAKQDALATTSAHLYLADTNNVRFSLIGGDVNGAHSHIFDTANVLTGEYQALNTDGTNEYLATLSASLDDSFSQLQLRKTIGANVTSSIRLDAKDAPSVQICDTNGIVFSVVTNGTITLQGRTNRIGDDGSQITFNGAAVGGGGILTNDAGSVSLLDQTESYRIVQPNNNFYAVTGGGNLTNLAAFNNIAIGDSALANAVDAGDNIALGTEALLSTDHTDYDIAIGYHAERLMQNGGGNVAIGERAMQFATNAAANVAIGGGDAARHMISGADSVAIGYAVDLYDASYAVAIGHQASALQDYSIAIGDNASAQGTHSVTIGDGVVTSTDYEFVLGNVAHTYIFPGTNSASFSSKVAAAAGFAKGSFTGITTTNTFYSVAANLLSTVTNVVVVQGGIITSWTVTP